MFTQYIHAVLLSFLMAGLNPSNTPMQDVPDSSVQMQNAGICSEASFLFTSIYDMYENKVERAIVSKALLDQVYNALPGQEGAYLAAVVERSINVLYSVDKVPDKVSWFYMTQLYCVNDYGFDLLADQHADILGKPKQRKTGE